MDTNVINIPKRPVIWLFNWPTQLSFFGNISDLLHKRVKLEFKFKWNWDLAYNFSDVSKYV